MRSISPIWISITAAASGSSPETQSWCRKPPNLFDADTKRQTYNAGSARFLVSPVNARKELAKFIRGAKKELLIYDPKISDRAMLRLLEKKINDGVEIRLIGCVAGGRLPDRELSRLRLHTRTIIRDRSEAFVGSQSLRQLELDARREIGAIFRDTKAIKELVRTFEEDWNASESAKEQQAERVVKTARKMAKVIARRLPVNPVVKHVLKTIEKKADDPKAIASAVKSVVKDVVNETVEKATKEVMEDLAESNIA